MRKVGAAFFECVGVLFDEIYQLYTSVIQIWKLDPREVQLQCNRNAEEMVSYLLQWRSESDGNYGALHHAARLGLKRAVLELIKKGADVDLQASRGVTPLISALSSRTESAAQMEIGSLLIDSGCSVNSKAGPYEFAALHFAYQSDREEHMKKNLFHIAKT